jgi:hypothetical protein
MSAVEALQAAQKEGVRLTIEGSDLVLDADTEPPATVLDALSRHKAGIVALLRPANDGWSAEDGRLFFDERAAIAEFDGGLSPPEAETQAFECCVAEWMNRNPQPSEPGRCAWCCEREYAEGSVVVPFGTDSRGHTWLHHRCWSQWDQHRRKRAAEALVAMGIKPNAAPGVRSETGALENAKNPNDFAKSGGR